MKPAARKVILQSHLWAGLTVGLVLVVMAVTGALMVYRPQLERRLDRKRFVVEPGSGRLSADELVVRARAAHPASQVESVRFYADPTMPFLVKFKNEDFAHLNPYTGEVLGLRRRYGEGFGLIEGIHRFMTLEPSKGEVITGSTALVFSLIAISGVILWWPATRWALKAGLTVNHRLSGRPWNFNLHKTVGIYAVLVVLASSVTGISIWLDWAKTPFQLPNPPQHAAFAGFAAAAQSIASRFPAAPETFIPVPKSGLVAAYVIEPGAGHPNARSYLWLDPATAAVLHAIPYREATPGFRAYFWMISLHTGLIGGPVVQLLLLLGALAIPVLAYTGTASYVRRKYGRTTKEHARAPAPTTAPETV